eukprot:10397414-Alexandrium_andersonii.AAC.1
MPAILMDRNAHSFAHMLPITISDRLSQAPLHAHALEATHACQLRPVCTPLPASNPQALEFIRARGRQWVKQLPPEELCNGPLVAFCPGMLDHVAELPG